MRRPSLIVAMLGCALLPAMASAQVMEQNFLVGTTGDLVLLCASQPGDPFYTAAQNFCHGYAVGVYQTIEAQQSARATALFCPPAQMPTRTEAIANFVRWAQASSARVATAPTEGIASYLVERLPCRSAAR